MYKINIKSNQDANTHNLTNAKRRGQWIKRPFDHLQNERQTQD